MIRLSIGYIPSLLLWPSLALGHAGDLLESLDVKPPSDSDASLMIESTIGMLWSETGGDYRWVCHESVTRADSLMTPRYIRSSAGFTLVTVPKEGEGREEDEVVYRSTDHCDWSPVTGLTGQVVVDFALDTQAPETVYAITNTPDATNGVRVSVDGGQSWSPTGFADSQHQQSSILAGDGLVWSTAVDFSSKAGWLYRSSNGGASWEQWPLDLSEYDSPPDIRLLELHDAGVWFRTTQTLKDDLWTLDISEGAPTRLYSGDTKIMSAVELDDGRLFAALFNQGIALYQDGALQLVPDSPSSYAVRSDGVTLYAATRPIASGHGMMTSSDGLVFKEAFGYPSLGPPPACAPESHSALACEPLWADLEARLTAEPSDTGDSGGEQTVDPVSLEESSGCGKSSKAQAALFFFLPAFGRRRGRIVKRSKR